MFKFLVVVLGLLHITIATNPTEKSNAEPMLQSTCLPSIETILQYQTPSGSWIPDGSTNGCVKDKLEILKHCQRLYKDKDITNIVEGGGPGGGICRKVAGKIKCGGRNDGGGGVVVYRCLESPFQSDALLVPSPCIFDHIHNSSLCLESKVWNQTALSSCQKRNFKLKSFAVLLPCGVGLFTGVEFVCCPAEKVEKKTDDYYDDDDDEEEDEYYFEDGSTTPPPPPSTTVDPYFQATNYDPVQEHTNFKQAEDRLENLHRNRMSKVMRDWEELEKKYKGMEGKEAEEFKRTVTARFQKTIKNLEEEGLMEKRQLVAVHQQRVLTHLNTRKKESMECFTQSLTTSNSNKIRKCLEKLMRILHKDRHHTITHMKHLQKTNPKQAEIEKEYTLQRLGQISLTAREAVSMLGRFPEISTKLLPLINDYVLSLQGRDDFGSILSLENNDKEILGFEVVTTTTTTTTEATTVKPASTTTSEVEADEETIETEERNYVKDQIISVRREIYTSNKLTFIVAFGAIATGLALLIGMAILLKKKFFDDPKRNGFLQVNQNLTPPSLKSPEEKHVANMQINGYENPTYKYFEQN